MLYITPLREERKYKGLGSVSIYGIDKERILVETMPSQHGDEANSIATPTGSRLKARPQWNLFNH